MRTYQCWSCNVTLSEVDKLWDATVNVGRCPRCYEALREAVSLQEKIYNNISLISQGSRSLWVLAVLLFLTMYATAPLIFGNAYWTDWMKLSATQVTLDVAMPAAYILFCYSIGVLSCKTSKRLGIFLLMFSLFLLIGFGFFILFFISELIVGRVPSQINFEFSSQNFHNFTGRITGQIDLLEVLKQDAKTATLFLVGVSLDAVIALYVGVVLTKAAYWFVFADPFSRTMVSDIYKTPMFSKASFSRTLGLPFSITHVKVRRSKVLFYLVVSSISFSASAAALASLPMAVTTAMSLGNLSIFITPAVSAREAAEALHQMGIHTFLLPPLLLPTAAVFLFIGVSAQRVGRRHATSSIEEVQELDVRRPILFLRAFRDDQLCLANPKLPLMSMSRVVGLVRGKVSLDVMLLEEGIDYGPVVALGNPQDSLPPYGAARGYFDDRTWHDGVAALAQTSSVIVRACRRNR